MRKLITALFMILLLTACPQAANLTFKWDAMPAGAGWQKVRIYEVVGTTYTMVAEVPATESQVTINGVVPGAHRYIARSYDGFWESVDSNEATTPNAPNPPTTVIITIKPNL